MKAAAALLVAAGCALAAGADTFVAAPAAQRCVFHLHTPKCAGTFVWRFLKGRFCADEARICGRDALRPPPACACVVNPITKDEAVLGAIRRGAYAFASSHSRAPFKSSTACALAVWFREPLARVRSHYGYFKYKKHRNLTSLADLYKRGTPPHWVSNQQWALLLPAKKVSGSRAPSDGELRAATREVTGLAFVGLVEDMETSLCVFAAAYLPAHARDLCDRATHAKRENVAVAARAAADDARERDLVRKYNRYDAALYDAARAEFARRKEVHEAEAIR